MRPPTITVTAGAGQVPHHSDGPGFLFLGPGPVSLSGSQQYGPLIVGRRGEPLWFKPVAPGLEVTNFHSSHYRGEPVLVWWEGRILGSGYGQGEAVIVDRSYRELARVRAAGGLSMDMHALSLTPKGTALFTCYPQTVDADLSSIGGPRQGQALQSIVQEVEISTGRLLLEWRSLEHIPAGDSYEPIAEPYDYLHVNSVAPTTDGNLLVSGRHTWALYKLERRTGKVIWTLGGKHSDFGMAPGAQFSWQHDATQVSRQHVTLFDNGTNGSLTTERQSRGLLLALDEARRTAAVARSYPHPGRLSASAMGSVQLLPSGHVLVGWGTAAHISEFAPDGTLLYDAALPSGMYSYRALWLVWRSVPHGPPALAAAPDPHGRTKLVYASWNGATTMTEWQVNAGAGPRQLTPVGIAKHLGFETAIPLHPGVAFASVTPLDRSGQQLRQSAIIELSPARAGARA